MGSLLINGWLGDEELIEVVDEASVSIVRERVREEGAHAGLPGASTAALVDVASELAHNQLAHASRGVVAVRTLTRRGVSGVEVVAADEGTGIESPTDAFRGAPTVVEAEGPRASLGIGLAAAMELADELDVDVRIGEGTCLWARKFVEQPLTRRQLGIYGRPYPREIVSGDQAGFLWHGEDLILGVADGLGHGEPAREASDRVIAAMRRHSGDGLDDMLRQAHHNVIGTRGAVVALGKLVDAHRSAEAACVGNVSFHLYGDGRCMRSAGISSVVGDPRGVRMPMIERFQFGLHDKVVVFTDGLSSRTSVESDLELLREHPIIIAHRMVERFGRSDDDALVLVAG